MKQSREKAMDRLNKEYKNSFVEIYKNQNKVLVYGAGNLNASLVLVGEAPGEQETIHGLPFVGQAGKNLDEFLEILELERDNLYITNVVKFRPFKENPDTGRKSNRPPNKEEIGLSKSWLYRELYIINPSIVVTLGNTALRAIVGKNGVAIGQVHGTPMKVALGEEKISTTLFPLYHPASIIYRRELREVYMEDLHKLKNYLSSPLN